MKPSLQALQPLGRALMLPIAVLPIAGMLLRLGQPDLLNVAFVSAAGSAVFDNLGLLFALGIGVGLAKDNNGAAGLAGVVCFLVATRGAQTLLTVPPETVAGMSKDMAALASDAWRTKAIAKLSVPIGILSGISAGALYNRYATIKLPDYLAFFGGRRFVPILSGLVGLLLAAIVGFTYASLNAGVDGLSRLVIGSGVVGLFVYGVLNLTSMSLTSFLTGVTEPVEFTFIFLAPSLFLIHALLTGAAMAIAHMLGMLLGFGFSAGFFDYALNFPKATRPLLLLPMGAIYALLYYGIFRFAIVRFDLKTPGREAEPVGEEIADAPGDRGAAFVLALGGAGNLRSIDACTTRLRLVVGDQSLVSEPRLRALGAVGIVRPSAEGLQVVLGPIADAVAMEMRAAAGPLSTAESPRTAVAQSLPKTDAGPWVKALGGRDNVLEAGSAASRVWLKLKDAERVEEAALTMLGVRMIARPEPGSVHLLVSDAEPIAAALQPS